LIVGLLRLFYGLSDWFTNFLPQTECLLTVFFEGVSNLADRCDYLLQKDLENRVWSRKTPTQLLRLRQNLLILAFETLVLRLAHRLRLQLW
jgi:hypothetical protein